MKNKSSGTASLGFFLMRWFVRSGVAALRSWMVGNGIDAAGAQIIGPIRGQIELNAAQAAQREVDALQVGAARQRELDRPGQQTGEPLGQRNRDAIRA